VSISPEIAAQAKALGVDVDNIQQAQAAKPGDYVYWGEETDPWGKVNTKDNTDSTVYVDKEAAKKAIAGLLSSKQIEQIQTAYGNPVSGISTRTL
jgi:hypothetical protein